MCIVCILLETKKICLFVCCFTMRSRIYVPSSYVDNIIAGEVYKIYDYALRPSYDP